ncbi:MAG: threonine--tRNA ligase [Nitrososphaeraceae archaeon]|nr:threonine--tRNA ligase [Nitrososphaeraceae archaeon]
MRLLQLHSEYVEYTPISEEIGDAEKIKVETKKLRNLVVVFICIEKNDNKKIVDKALKEIKIYLEQIKVNKLLIYPYAHLSSDLATPKQAFELIKELEERAKNVIDDVQRAPFGWTKSFNISVKGHPLAENFKILTDKDDIGIEQTTNSSLIDSQEIVSSALDSEEKQRSSWYILDLDGNLIPLENFKSNNINFKKFIDYETSKRRVVEEQPPHVRLMKRMGIADYEPASDPGNVRFYPKGRLMKSLIEQFITRKVLDYGAIEVETPIMYDTKHPSMESYFNRFPARQYNILSDNKKLFLRFAACFGQFLMAKDFHITYKNLPLKLYELTRYSFRREKTGELVGLRRLRAFSMPDCHAFCKDMEQSKEEFLKRFELSIDVLKAFDLKIEDDIEMAVRFTAPFYVENKDFILKLLKKFGKPVLIEMWKERFFYFVLKWEFNYIDNSGKAAALSTDQIDVENGIRYKIEFVDENGQKRNPIILHNSPSGAIERIIYSLLEKAAKIQQTGKRATLPLWLIHTQVRIIPIKEEYMVYAETIEKDINKNQIRVDIDDRDESVGKRIRDAETEWVPYILVIGEKEIESSELMVRDRMSGNQYKSTLEELIFKIKLNVQDKPFMPLNLPKYLSKRPQIMT